LPARQPRSGQRAAAAVACFAAPYLKASKPKLRTCLIWLPSIPAATSSPNGEKLPVGGVIPSAPFSSGRACCVSPLADNQQATRRQSHRQFRIWRGLTDVNHGLGCFAEIAEAGTNMAYSKRGRTPDTHSMQAKEASLHCLLFYPLLSEAWYQPLCFRLFKGGKFFRPKRQIATASSPYWRCR